MRKLERFARNRPLGFGVVVILNWIILLMLTYPLHFLFPPDEVGQRYGDAAAKTATCVFFVLVLWRLGWLAKAGVCRTVKRRDRWLIAGWGSYLIIAGIYAFTGDLSPAVASTPIGIAEFVGTLPGALLEELMFRGLILTAMLSAWGQTRRGVVRSVVLSSLLFGATHLFNALANPVEVVLFQAVVVSLPGVLYGALLLRTRTLWPAVLIHWLSNAAVNVKIVALADWQETPIMWLWFALFLIPPTVYSAYLLSKIPVGEPDEDGGIPQLVRRAET